MRRRTHDTQRGNTAGRRSARPGGSLLGKRYVNAAGNLELLCVKPGDGSLAADGESLVLKEAKPLPSSD